MLRLCCSCKVVESALRLIDCGIRCSQEWRQLTTKLRDYKKDVNAKQKVRSRSLFVCFSMPIRRALSRRSNAFATQTQCVCVSPRSQVGR
jgi:hypothetical protein